MFDTHYVDCTADFMRRMGLPVPTPNPDASTEALRMNLIVEELSETHKAMAAGDTIETADGLADTLYVIAGAAATYGVPFDLPEYALEGPPIAPTADHASSLLLEMLPGLDLTARAMASLGNEVPIEIALVSLGDALAGEAAALGLPLRELFDEVHRSNMTKDAAPAVGVVGKRGGKGPNYSPPDIRGVLEQAGWLA